MLAVAACPACGAGVGPFDERCSRCQRSLLPRQGGVIRMALGVGLLALGTSTSALWILGEAYDPWVTLTTAALGALLLLWGYRRHRRGGPLWQRLAIRARRTFRHSPEEALGDFMRAAALAPGCEALSIGGGRDELGTRRGIDVPKALLDMVLARFGPPIKALPTPEDAAAVRGADVEHLLYQTYLGEVLTQRFAQTGTDATDDVIGAAVELLGGPARGDIAEAMIADQLGAYRQQMGRIRAALLERGLVAAIGYCRECRDAVDLGTDADPQSLIVMRCVTNPKHEVRRHVVYETPESIELYRAAIRWIEHVGAAPSDSAPTTRIEHPARA